MWKFFIKQVKWLFKITQQDDWNFKIIPAGYWILREGFWDDNGIWMDTEVWNDG